LPSLNAHSPVPLYRQLADRLLAQIDAGTYGVDTKIPSENELADQFAIGRPTVRQATDMLVRQGRLERRRGSGTFVKPAAPSIDLLSLAGTSAAFTTGHLNASIDVITGPVRVSDDAFRVQRRASVDGSPVMLETLNFNAELFPGLDQHDVTNRSLSALVKEVYFLEPSSADQRFSVLLADTAQATTLDTEVGTPLLHVHRSLHFDKERNALFADILCLTDRFDFSQTLFPVRP